MTAQAPDGAARKALEQACSKAGAAELPLEGEHHVGGGRPCRLPLGLHVRAAARPRAVAQPPTPLPPLQYYKNFSGFKERLEGFQGRLQRLLTSLPVRRRRRRGARAECCFLRAGQACQQCAVYNSRRRVCRLLLRAARCNHGNTRLPPTAILLLPVCRAPRRRPQRCLLMSTTQPTG